MKVAIAGLGTMGRLHAANLAEMEHIQLVGAFDRSKESLLRFTDEFRIDGFDSFEAMVETTNPDVLCITLPTFLHKEYVMKAAVYGKHVICEKPISMSPEDAMEMIQACEEYNVKLFIGHVVRFFPEYRHLKKSIDEGAVGKIGVAHTKRAGPFPVSANNWYADTSKSGGVIMDLMIHDIDLMRWMIGEVRSVYALTRQSEELNHAFVTLRFDNGAIANLEACWGYPGPFTTAAELAGDGGVIRTDNQSSPAFKLLKRDAGSNQHNRVEVPASPAMHDPYFYELSHFLNCIASGVEPIVTATDAVKAVEIALAAIDSANTGMPVLLTKPDGTHA